MIRYELPVLWTTSCFRIMGLVAHRVYIPKRRKDSVTTEVTASFPTIFCLLIKTMQVIKSWVGHWGGAGKRSVLSTIVLFARVLVAAGLNMSLSYMTPCTHLCSNTAASR